MNKCKLFSIAFKLLFFQLIIIIIFFQSIFAEEDMDFTIMIYMIGSDLEDVSYEATKDINEILKADTSNSNVNLVLQTGGSEGKADGERIIDFSTVKRHKISDGKINTVSDLGTINMANNDTFYEFLKWGIDNYPAKKYGLILWGHGVGLDGYGMDINFGKDKLYLYEIESALSKSINKNNNLEFIGFDACLMASLEVASKLSDTYPLAKYLIASEEIEPNWGWNYTKIINTIFTDSNVSGDILGKQIIDSYVRDSKAISKSEKFGADREITLSVIDLHKIQKLGKNLDQLVVEIVEETIKDKASMLKLLHSIDLTEHYGQNGIDSKGIIDLYDFLSNLGVHFPILNDKITGIKKIIDQVVVYNYNGESSKNANGLSIYLPLTQDERLIKDLYVKDGLILPVYSPNWNGFVLHISMVLEKGIDLFPPIIKSERSKENITINAQGSDISNIFVQKIISSSNGNPIQYIQNENPFFIDEKGFFKYKTNKMLALCNEIECLPVSTIMDVSRDEKTQWVFVDKVSPSGEQELSLPYEFYQDNFIFLGAIERMNVKGDPLPKQKISLDKGDIIYPIGMKFDLNKETYYSSDPQSKFKRITGLYDSSQIRDKFLEVIDPSKIKLQYISINSSSTKITFCDYANNCDDTRTYDYENHQSYDEKSSSFFLSASNVSDNILNDYTYINSKYEFQLEFPFDWVPFTSKMNRQYVSPYSDITDPIDPEIVLFAPYKEILNYKGKLMPLLLVRVEDSKHFNDPKRLFNTFNKTSNINSELEYKIISANNTLINSNPAFEFILQSNTNSDKRMGITEKRLTYFISIIMNHREYTLTFESYESTFPQYIPIVKEIVNNFKPKEFHLSNINKSDYKIVNEKEILSIIEKGQSSQHTKFKNYTDKKYGFIIEYPYREGITQITNNTGMMGYLVAISLPYKDNLSFNMKPIVGIHISDITETNRNDLGLLDKYDIADSFSPEVLSKALPDFHLLNSTTIKLNGYYYSVYEMSYFYFTMGDTINEKAVQTVIGDKFVKLSLITLPSDYSMYEPVFDKMIKSFKFKNNEVK
jgi:hypothetical protein